MCGVIDSGPHHPEDEVVAGKGQHALQRGLDYCAWDGELAEFERGDQRAGDAEDGSRCACAVDVGVYEGAGEAGGHAANQVDGGERPATVHGFGHLAEAPEAPHIQSDVDDANVNEDRGEQSPPLATHGPRSVVGTPADEVRATGRGERGSRCDHSNEDGGADSSDGLGD